MKNNNNWKKELGNLLTKMSEDYLIDDEFEAQLKWFIANALKDYVREVIGEDELEYDDLYDMEMRDYKIRNRLRAEQRKKLEEEHDK